jgi:hypothetical protein
MIPLEDIEWFALIYAAVIGVSIFVNAWFHIGE